MKRIRSISKGLFYYTSKTFLDWIDSQNKNFDLSNKDSVIDAYRRYSKYLVDCTLLTDTEEESLAAHTAKQYQRNVAKLIAYVFDCHEIDIVSQAMQVQSQRYDVPILPIAEEDHQKTYATLLNVFLEIHRIVVQEGNFPAHFQSVNEEDFYFYSGFHHQTEKQHIQFDIQSYLAKYSSIPTLSKMLADFELEEDSEYRKRLRENRNQAIRNLEERNKDKRHMERERLCSLWSLHRHAVIYRKNWSQSRYSTAVAIRYNGNLAINTRTSFFRYKKPRRWKDGILPHSGLEI